MREAPAENCGSETTAWSSRCCGQCPKKGNSKKMEIQFFFYRKKLHVDEFWQKVSHSVGNYKNVKTPGQCMSLTEKTWISLIFISLFSSIASCVWQGENLLVVFSQSWLDGDSLFWQFESVCEVFSSLEGPCCCTAERSQRVIIVLVVATDVAVVAVARRPVTCLPRHWKLRGSFIAAQRTDNPEYMKNPGQNKKSHTKKENQTIFPRKVYFVSFCWQFMADEALLHPPPIGVDSIFALKKLPTPQLLARAFLGENYIRTKGCRETSFSLTNLPPQRPKRAIFADHKEFPLGWVIIAAKTRQSRVNGLSNCSGWFNLCSVGSTPPPLPLSLPTKTGQGAGPGRDNSTWHFFCTKLPFLLQTALFLWKERLGWKRSQGPYMDLLGSVPHSAGHCRPQQSGGVAPMTDPETTTPMSPTKNLRVCSNARTRVFCFSLSSTLFFFCYKRIAATLQRVRRDFVGSNCPAVASFLFCSSCVLAKVKRLKCLQPVYLICIPSSVKIRRWDLRVVLSDTCYLQTKPSLPVEWRSKDTRGVSSLAYRVLSLQLRGAYLPDNGCLLLLIGRKKSGDQIWCKDSRKAFCFCHDALMSRWCKPESVILGSNTKTSFTAGRKQHRIQQPSQIFHDGLMSRISSLVESSTAFNIQARILYQKQTRTILKDWRCHWRQVVYCFIKWTSFDQKKKMAEAVSPRKPCVLCSCMLKKWQTSEPFAEVWNTKVHTVSFKSSRL